MSLLKKLIEMSEPSYIENDYKLNISHFIVTSNTQFNKERNNIKKTFTDNNIFYKLVIEKNMINDNILLCSIYINLHLLYFTVSFFKLEEKKYLIEFNRKYGNKDVYAYFLNFIGNILNVNIPGNIKSIINNDVILQNNILSLNNIRSFGNLIKKYKNTDFLNNNLEFKNILLKLIQSLNNNFKNNEINLVTISIITNICEYGLTDNKLWLDIINMVEELFSNRLNYHIYIESLRLAVTIKNTKKKLPKIVLIRINNDIQKDMFFSDNIFK